MVSGSTGWKKDHEADVERLIAQGNTLFWASNFSLGVAIFSATSRYLAKLMNRFPNYDVSMEETHHIHKLDAPSGTAITLAEDIVARLDRKDHWEKGRVQAADGSISGRTDCPPDALRIDAIRRDEVPAFTPSPMTVRKTAYASPTMPTADAALHWAPYWRQNSPPPIPGCSPRTICSTFNLPAA